MCDAQVYIQANLNTLFNDIVGVDWGLGRQLTV